MKNIRISSSVAGLIVLGIVLGLWINRPREPSIDLGAAAPKFVAAGTMKLLDVASVEVATVGVDIMPPEVQLRIDLNNGANGYLGYYTNGRWGANLVLTRPVQGGTDNVGQVTVEGFSLDDFYNVYSKPPQSSGVFVPVHRSRVSTFSREWWLSLMDREGLDSLESEISSEDTRLVRRDGTPFAVCGRDKYGIPTIAFVSSKLALQSILKFSPIQTDDGSTVSTSLEVYNVKGQNVALVDTRPSPGPQLSLTSAVDHDSEVPILGHTLDPTGTKLIPFRSPYPQGDEGVVSWLAQPMYRGRLPLRLIGADGSEIWFSGKTIGR
ncbi:hypothetical protein ACPOL_6530 [Acidisarcina polymorpha]|uniref:Uncharacterized protein n=1 Tax=Acidisarcina polymorpha TaxID=2211140 RepID=A0A2Z5GA12_9BACT|nr:hypothetical protein [Acidisarcina polymorpha]AXC15750.1 hypothetical protein ACPOL_6530 [Acidisarcina polymorpha]